MKNHFKVMIVGLVLAFGSATAFAMSELASVVVTPLWPTNSNPGKELLYEIRLERLGAGKLEVDMSCGGFPGGCNASFTRGSIRYTGNDPRYVFFTMSVASDQPAPADCCPFTVTGTALRESVTFTNTPSTALRLGDVPSQMVAAFSRQAGDVEIRGLGNSGQQYQIQAATSLLNPTWSPVGFCTADGNGRFTFFHTGASQQGVSAQFYRAVKVASN